MSSGSSSLRHHRRRGPRHRCRNRRQACGLITRLDFWAGHYKAPNGDEKRRQESEWERRRFGAGVVFGFFAGPGEQHGR